MSQRSVIQNSVTVCGESNGTRFLRRFTISEKLSTDGSTVICYMAKHENSGWGILKEFYPVNADFLVRDENEQLIHMQGMEEEKASFQRMQQEYLEPYRMLLDICKQHDIATFIPPFEIYYGCDENYHLIGTVYIWTPEPKRQTFEKLCKEIQEHPTIQPEQKLAQVLYSIESLVKCVRLLHRANLIHRDIKPSNFGFLMRGSEVLTQTISIFDVDAMCSVYHVPKQSVGTPGFMEPEIFTKKACNQTDIYSIGAMLFYAVIITEETKQKGYLFDPTDYQKLKELVNRSELLQASNANFHPRLRNSLLRILQKTLCSRDERYQSCEELLKEIQKALYYAAPAEIAAAKTDGEQWVLADPDDLRSRSQDKNSTLALQYHLYTHPLYADVPHEKETISLLLVGFGTYSQKFLDIALQTSQVTGKTLHVTIVAQKKEDREHYLSERPELDQFFNIDGSLQGESDVYGNIQFVIHDVSSAQAEENQAFFSELFCNVDLKPDYAFVAAGENRRNLAIAKMITPVCAVSVAWEGRYVSQKEIEGMIPVYLTEDMSDHPFCAELERMAFNVHLIWKKDLNLNFSKVRREFRRSYNHHACISFVLAMKYMLYGLEIDMDGAAPTEIARCYLERINSSKSKKNELICLEHRRWVTEKLCLGYSRITDLEECAGGMTKDEKRKRHVCIVRSSPKQTLSSKRWSNGSPDKPNKAMWDAPNAEGLDELDELDRMSVELHRMYMKHANAEKKNNLLNGDIVSAIRHQIEPDGECMAAFQELLTCMKDIWNGDSMQCRRYAGLKERFIRIVKDSETIIERDRVSLQQLMEYLHEKFYPILASQQYRNFKREDTALVEGVPFILTYSDTLYMAIPFATGSNTEIFANLAAPTVVNPSRIIYIAYCSSLQELQEIQKILPYLFSYMEKKRLRAGVEFVIGFKSGLKIGNENDVEQTFRNLTENKILRVRCIPTESRREFSAFISDYLRRRINNSNLMLEMNETPLSGVMEGAGIFDLFSSYRYDSAKMKFTAVHDCDIVRYIRVKPSITVTDMFAFTMASSSTSNKPEFQSDYRALWEQYRLNTGAWKAMCRIFERHAEENDLLAYFRRDNRNAALKKEYRYLIPFVCKKAVLKIMEPLIAEKMISPESRVISYTTDSCEVIIQDLCNCKEKYDAIFSQMYMLMRADYVRCDVNPRDHVVKVFYNDLRVVNMNCRELYDNGFALIEYLWRKSYLIDLKIDRSSKTVSFTYATPQIKDLLTTEGRMLEVYTYHKAKETGRFDDIRSSFEIDWERSLATNEFDCVLTKGFSVLFVECKATREIKTTFYMKISSLVQHFGINATAVLLADTQDTPESAPLNAIQREHGEQFGVVTISDRKEIENIGNVLESIINGTYQEK